ncbi:uncharacterized protein LOC125034801 isoform X2 [Penaeus chinensis]|uniref:uncharacterized protein LOC125034801 isoform X2 n=1 Tax=Penaeus chinensis TaxID=139456 RepID=UPI001FB8220D|nr:uncharacterized protein LOC125034801 isoform X2 [Penaeus chinensis]
MDPNNEDAKSSLVAGISSFVLQSPSKLKTSLASSPVSHYGLRPYHLTCPVRSQYEEAAVRYVSAARTTALFPLTPTAGETLPKITGSATENCLRKCDSERTETTRRWTYKSVRSSNEGRSQRLTPDPPLERPVQHVSPTFYSDSHHATPSTSLSSFRLFEQEDSIGQGISGMRYDFVPPMRDSERSTATANILLKPKEITARKTFPEHRRTSCAAVPKQARRLFRNSLRDRDEDLQNHKSDTVLRDEEIHVEEEYPSQYSFLFYRLDANGHHVPVPVTVISPLQPKCAQSNSCTPELMTRDNLLGHTTATNEKHQVSVKDTITRQMTSFSNLSQQPVKHSYLGKMETGDLTPAIIASKQLSDNVSLLAKETFNKSQDCNDISEIISNNHSNSMETDIGDKSCNCDSPISEAHMDNDLQVVFDKRRRDVPNFIILSSDSSPEMESFYERFHINDMFVYKESEKASNSFEIPENECISDLPDITHSVVSKGCTPSNFKGSLNEQGVSLTLKEIKETKCLQYDDETDSLASTIIFDPVCENITDVPRPEVNHKQNINNCAETVSQQNSRDDLEYESFLLGRHGKIKNPLLQNSPRLSLNISENLRPEQQNLHIGMERTDLRSENITFMDMIDGRSMYSAMNEDFQRMEDSKIITSKSPISATNFKRGSQLLKVGCNICPGKLQGKESDHSGLADSLSVVGISHGNINLPIHTPTTICDATSGQMSATYCIKKSQVKECATDSCKFADSSATLFVSDGDLILPIHTQAGVIVDFVDVVQMLHKYKNCVGKKESNNNNQNNMAEDNSYITINIDVQGNNWKKSTFDSTEVSAIIEKLAIEEKKPLHMNQGVENFTLYQKDAIGSEYYAMLNQTEVIRNQGHMMVDQKCGSIKPNAQGQYVENLSNYKYFDISKEMVSFLQEGMNLGIMANEELLASSTVNLEHSSVISENSVNQNNSSRQIKTVARNLMENDKIMNINVKVTEKSLKFSQDLDFILKKIMNRAEIHQEVIMNSEDINQNDLFNDAKVHDSVEHKNNALQESAVHILGEEPVTDNKNTIRQRTLVDIINHELYGKQKTIIARVNILNLEKQRNIENMSLKQNNVLVKIEDNNMNMKAKGNQEVMISRHEDNLIIYNMVLNNNSVIHDRVAVASVCKIKTESKDGYFKSGLLEMNNGTEVEFPHPRSTNAISIKSELQDHDFIASEHDKGPNDFIVSEHEKAKTLANVGEIQEEVSYEPYCSTFSKREGGIPQEVSKFKASKSILYETKLGFTHKEQYSNDTLTNSKELSCVATINNVVSPVEPSDNCQLGLFNCVNSEKSATGNWTTRYRLKGPLTLDGSISTSYHPTWKQKYLGTVQDIINETFMMYRMQEDKWHHGRLKIPQEAEELALHDHEGKCNVRTLSDIHICNYKNVQTQSDQDSVTKTVEVKVGKGQIQKDNPRVHMICQTQGVYERMELHLQDIQNPCQDNGPYIEREKKAMYTKGRKSEDTSEISVAHGRTRQNEGKSWELTPATRCQFLLGAAEEIQSNTNGNPFVDYLPCSDNIKIISNASEKPQSEPVKELPVDFLLRISQKIDQVKGKPERTQHQPLQNKRQHDFNEKLEKFIKKYHNTNLKSAESSLEAKEQCPLILHQAPYNRERQSSEPPQDSQVSKHGKRVEKKVGDKKGNISRKADSFKEGTSHGRKNMNRDVDNILKRIEAPLDELHMRFLRVLQAEGNVLLSSLKGEGECAVVSSHQYFSSLRPDHTRFLLNQLLRMRASSYDRPEDGHYRKVLMLHGLVKAANLLMHYGICSATLCLREFQNTHPILMPGYVMVLARLERLQEGVSDLTHPKVKVIMKKMAQVRQQTDFWDADLKILILTRRQNSAVSQQLKRHLGHDAVYCLESTPNYRDFLHVLETHSVVVCEEWNGLQDLPYSQFGIVFQWEADGEPSPCVSHCVRQNIQVVALSTVPPRPTVTRTKQELALIEGISSSFKRVGEGSGEMIRDDGKEGRDKERMKTKKGIDPFTFIASSRLINHAELHYILTSVFNIFLVERSLSDLVDGEDCKRGWADLVVDERTCILLQPLAHLRTDTHVHYLTKQLVLLSLQCATCYLILYSDPRLDYGYIFRSNVVKALTRLVAACTQFRFLDYTVSICLASTIEQAGQMVREVAEVCRAASTTWDQEEWTSRPWLTHHMSSHERFLLALPCTNSITSQVILTAVPLSKFLTSSLTSLLSSVPWLPCRIIAMLHKLLHGEDGEDLESTVIKDVENHTLTITSDQDGLSLHEYQGSSGVVVSSSSDYFPLPNTSYRGELDANPCTNKSSKRIAFTFPITQHSTTEKGMAVNNYFGRNSWGMTCLDQSTQHSEFDDKHLTSQCSTHQVFQSLQQECPLHQEYSVHVIPQQKQPPQCLQHAQQYSVQHVQNINLHSKQQLPYSIQRKDSETLINAPGGRSKQQSGNMYSEANVSKFPSPYFDQLPGACSLTAGAASLPCNDNCSGIVECVEGQSHITENRTYMTSPDHEYWWQRSNPNPKTGQQASDQNMSLVPPSPRVILRQPGRSHHFPSEYDPSPSESAEPPSVKKLAYQMVSGMGGQTKLVLKNA